MLRIKETQPTQGDRSGKTDDGMGSLKWYVKERLEPRTHVPQVWQPKYAWCVTVTKAIEVDMSPLEVDSDHSQCNMERLRVGTHVTHEVGQCPEPFLGGLTGILKEFGSERPCA